MEGTSTKWMHTLRENSARLFLYHVWESAEDRWYMCKINSTSIFTTRLHHEFAKRGIAPISTLGTPARSDLDRCILSWCIREKYAPLGHLIRYRAISILFVSRLGRTGPNAFKTNYFSGTLYYTTHTCIVHLIIQEDTYNIWPSENKTGTRSYEPFYFLLP